MGKYKQQALPAWIHQHTKISSNKIHFLKELVLQLDLTKFLVGFLDLLVCFCKFFLFNYLVSLENPLKRNPFGKVFLLLDIGSQIFFMFLISCPKPGLSI